MATDEETARTTLENKLRLALGSSGVNATATVMQSAIDSALDDLSRLVPKVSYAVIDLVDGQALYDAPADTYDVLDVVFPDMTSVGHDELHMELVEVHTSHYEPTSHSTAIIEAQQWEQFTNLFGFDWEYDPDTNKVRVMPVPSSSMKMALKVSTLRTVYGMPVKMVRVLEELALSEGLRAAAAGMGAGITSIPIGIGDVAFDPSQLVAQADVVRQNAIRKLGIGGGSVVVG